VRERKERDRERSEREKREEERERKKESKHFSLSRVLTLISLLCCLDFVCVREKRERDRKRER